MYKTDMWCYRLPPYNKLKTVLIAKNYLTIKLNLVKTRVINALQDLLFRPLLQHTWDSFQGNGHEGLLALSPKTTLFFQTFLLLLLHFMPLKLKSVLFICIKSLIKFCFKHLYLCSIIDTFLRMSLISTLIL